MSKIEYFVYIVECNDGTYYTGIARDVHARIAKHNSGKGAKYTRARRPVILRWAMECGDKSSALKQEYNIKQMSREQKEEVVIFGSETQVAGVQV